MPQDSKIEVLEALLAELVDALEFDSELVISDEIQDIMDRANQFLGQDEDPDQLALFFD